jgi:hypothetical protein
MTNHHPLSEEQEPEFAFSHGRGAGKRPDVRFVVFLKFLFQELEALRLTLGLLQFATSPG